jgi:hypothetical protein
MKILEKSLGISQQLEIYAKISRSFLSPIKTLDYSLKKLTLKTCSPLKKLEVSLFF